MNEYKTAAVYALLQALEMAEIDPENITSVSLVGLGTTWDVMIRTITIDVFVNNWDAVVEQLRRNGSANDETNE